MGFSMFVTWVLVGVLMGVLAERVMKRGGYGLKKDITLGLVGAIGGSWLFRAIGPFPEAGIIAMAFVAAVGAAIPIIAQRTLMTTELPGDDKTAVWKWGFGAVLVVAVLWMTLGPTPKPTATAAVIEDKTYAVTPAAMKVKAGIVTGEVTEMKVAERVEQGSGRITGAAKLTARLRLTNSSTNQTVRLVGGKILYVDTKGQPIKFDDTRADPTLKFSSERLDPGQETTESLDVDFPAEALKANRLARIRLDLAYVPSPYKEETLNLAVSIGEPK
ncbi:MAG: hypothetical protein DMD81_15975 [Candidatus Rokuibacteriota bacterium]|nr:MAG: hypothetical protein DMD81_15975 [Candidatus Rokubacteria bacterium]